MNWSDYKRQIRHLTTQYGIRGIIVGAVPLVIKDDKDRQGGKIVIGHPGIQFKDGAHLIVRETVRANQITLECQSYTYHYERPSGYFFRYERELTTDPVRKPEFHLHVMTDLPHYPSGAVTLGKVLEFIDINFYSTQYHRTVVGQEIHLVV